MATQTEVFVIDFSRMNRFQMGKKLGRVSVVGAIGVVMLAVLVGCVSRPPVPARPKLAIILDDAGEKTGFYKDIYALPCPVTLAIIPFAPQAQAVLSMTRKHKLDVIGHIPMQSPITSEYAAVLATNMTASEISLNLTRAIDLLPGIQGINNHMGSLASMDRPAMDAVMAVLEARKMFIVDSRTTRDSQIVVEARDWGVACVAKDEFLDSEAGQEKIEKHLRYLLSLARKRGYAVGIGHVQNLETIMVLNEFMHKHARDVELVGINRLIKAI